MAHAARFTIKSYFVPTGKTARQQFKWKYHDSRIRGKDGQVYYQKKRVKAPEGWSATAIDIAASKYFRKSQSSENSIEALVERIGQGLSRAAEQSELFKSKKDIRIFIEEIKYILYSQKAAFNSPVWFNLGLYESYGVKSQSEHFVWNKKKKAVVSVKEAYRHPQTSACFIQSIDDNLESILGLLESESKLFKFGSGSGTNFSSLRGKSEKLSSGGYSSGLISFLEVLDKAAGAIKSGGTTRRAAKMVCLDLDHPEVEDFIRWKWKEEEKAKSLIAQGYSADLDSEAYRTVSGQNANNSVRIPDRFMRAIGKNKKWSLVNRTDGKTFKQVLVDDLWKQICEAAWHCADPGLQFEDTINTWHTCGITDSIKASNPCSEYMFLDNSACNLASLNLVKFLDEQQGFLLDEFIYVCRLMFMAQECLVDFSSYPTSVIAQNSHDYRPLGLGFANLGSFFMRKALPYDSDEARAWAGSLTAILAGTAYKTSGEMAAVLGSFVGYKKNKTEMLRVMKRHQNSLKNIQWKSLPEELKLNAADIWQQVLAMGTKQGYRNAQATVIAPTGTIGLIMDCDTTGIEPDFSLIKNKKLSGGGYLQIVNHSVSYALKVLGYNTEAIENSVAHVLRTGSIRGSGIQAKHEPIFACATGDLALSAEAHLKMMASVQPFISGAISKTVNLPAESTIEDISRTYFQAWKLGLKSVAIYRDGSKFAQPLNAQLDVKTGSTQQADADKPLPLCGECGHQTVLESGCYRCLNCGTTTACAS